MPTESCLEAEIGINKYHDLPIDFDLPTPEVRSSNPAISKFKIYFQLYRKDKNTEKEAENVIFLKWAISY